MQCLRLTAVTPACLVFLAFIHASPGGAQQYRWGLEVGIAAMNAYPRHLEDGCRDGQGVAPSAHAHFRPHWLISVEAGASVQFAVGGSEIIDCGGLVLPPLPGTTRTVRDYDATRSSNSLTTEGRLVVTPTGKGSSTLRLIGGAATYPGNGVYAWILGLGMHASGSRGGLIIDAERWWVGTRYMHGIVEYGPDLSVTWHERAVEREWERLWQLRVGFRIWSR
jgi:hypothetical protein